MTDSYHNAVWQTQPGARARRLTAALASVALATTATASVATPSRALASPSAAGASAPPTCEQTLDSLDARLRENYAGFLLEIRGERRTSYDSLRSALRQESRTAPYERCYPVLARFIDWFDDPHLFVFQSQAADSADAARRRAALRHLNVTEGALRRDLSSRGGSIDPIEGIWYDGPTRLGVVRDPAAGPGRFVGVLLASDTIDWPAGAVRAEFERRADGSYAARLLTRAFAEMQLTARIHRRVVLRLSPGMWGKAFPVPPSDSGTIDSSDVHRPHLTIRPRSVVVSIPSHDPRFVRVLDGMVAAADSVIRDRRLLIVDLRGNEGGASFMTRVLNPYITTAERRPTPFDSGVAVMLSSKAQISYARRFTGNDTSAFVRSLVARLEANPGALVPLEESPSPADPEPSIPGDWTVVVLVDRGTVSASEVLVLRALRSTRAIVAGQNTAGALDYQSIQIVGLGTGDRRWALGYPTITAHADLPRRGMRGTGIAPTVRVDWDSLADPIAEMERRYAPPGR